MSLGSSSELFFAGTPGGAGYEIERSLRFNSADSAYLNRNFASAGNRKTWTWAGWVKRSGLSTTQQIFACRAASTPYTLIYFEISGQITFADNVVTGQYTWTAQYRDPSAWYHIVLAVDTTQATASNRLKLYVNGVLDTKSAGTDPTPNADTNINSTNAHAIGSAQPITADYFSGYLADIHFIDGQALDPTSFGEFDDNGIWQPIRYAGSYGTNGFHLPLSDNSTAAALGTDTSGNGNTWTVNNISVAAGAGNDSLVDVPTNGTQTDTGAGGEVRGNYATLNPLNGLGTISNGNLTQTNTNADHRAAAGTVGMSSGKWYWEVTLTTAGVNSSIGIAKTSLSLLTNQFMGSASDSWGYLAANGEKYNNAINYTYGDTWNTSGTVMGIAFDADAGTLTFYKNNVSQGTAFTGLTSGPYVPGISNYSNGVVDCNFGQRPFAYTAPSGFKALCTTNLPAPTIEDGSTVMDAVLYLGDQNGQTINVGFESSLLWGKQRNDADRWFIADTVRGKKTTGYYLLSSHLTTADTNSAPPDGITDISSTGFTLGANTSNDYGGWSLEINQTNGPYVAYCWDAGSSTVTNNDGSISSQVRANPSAGFSIVTYTGTGSAATVGHGLGVKPALVIAKGREVNQNWLVWHQGLSGESYYLHLETTGAQTQNSAFFSAFSSTTFSLGTSAHINSNGLSNVAYCFSAVAGYSAFGSYTGNGSADGPFVYTGFRPAFVLIKSTGVENWFTFDNARPGYNPNNNYLLPNSSSAESSVSDLDLLSNGFKWRSASSALNANGTTYIYAAFAESPFQFSRAR